MAMSNAQAAMAQDQVNTQACIQSGVNVVQKIASINGPAYIAGQALNLNLAPQNVGLIKRFILRYTFNVAQGASEVQALTTLGAANVFSNITFTDLNNLVRVNAPGWHFQMLASTRRQMPFASAYTTANTIGIGNNYAVSVATNGVTTGGTIKGVLEIPMSYSDNDLRGALFAQVVNSTMNLQLTINPAFFVAAGADGTNAVYQSSTAQLGRITSYQIDVYQEYIDQLPRNAQGQYMVPAISIATQYNQLFSSNTGMTAGNDFSTPFANLRSYNSVFLLYDNGGQLNGGTDINYFSLTTANSMQIFKYDAFMAQYLNGRNKIGDDWPLGMYWFDFRAKPLSTLAFGNMSLNMNASLVNANATLYSSFEFFANVNQLASAGSITST